jgi:hypothetical protein
MKSGKTRLVAGFSVKGRKNCAGLTKILRWRYTAAH